MSCAALATGEKLADIARRAVAVRATHAERTGVAAVHDLTGVKARHALEMPGPA
jgi:hypothetical protein